LSEAALSIGSPQTRNIGTVVGNVVNAQPAADAAVALVALGAEAEISEGTGSEWRLVEDLYAGVGVSRVKSNEQIVTAIRFRAQYGNQGSAFSRLALREALALPILNTAVKISVGADNTCTGAQIVVAPVAPHPFRCKKAEGFLTGTPLAMESFVRAAEEAAREANPRDSALRGTAEYRREMVKVLVRRAISKAVDTINP
jgi:carbon-monoxide dehydrogenase medium subunit